MKFVATKITPSAPFFPFSVSEEDTPPTPRVSWAAHLPVPKSLTRWLWTHWVPRENFFRALLGVWEDLLDFPEVRKHESSAPFRQEFSGELSQKTNQNQPARSTSGGVSVASGHQVHGNFPNSQQPQILLSKWMLSGASGIQMFLGCPWEPKSHGFSGKGPKDPKAWCFGSESDW